MRGRQFLILLISLGMVPVLAVPASAATGDIATFAGPAAGKAAGATLSSPSDVAADGSTVYILEGSAHRIRKVTSSGDITTVAGNGSAGFADGGATGSTLNGPKGISVGGSDLLIADAGNNRVRKLVGTTLSTIAGDGNGTWAGDGGAATIASLNGPSDVVTDADGNIYIADTGNNRIRKISAADGIISSYAGTGNAASAGDGGTADLADLDAPGSLAVSGTYLYVAEQSKIRRIALGSGIISTLTDLAASGLAVDAGDNLYATDAAGRVLKVIDSSGAVSTVAGSGTSGTGGDGGAALDAEFMQPSGVVLFGGSLLVADKQAGRVRKISSGTISGFAGTMSGCMFGGDDGPAVNAAMGIVTAVATDDDSNVYIADSCNGRIRKVTSGTITTIAGNGTFGNAGDGGPATVAQLGGDLGGLAVAGDKDSNRIVYLSDTVNNRVRKIEGGIISNVVDAPAPQGLALDAAGNLYIATGCTVQKVTGSTTTTFAGTGSCALSGDGGPATSAGVQPAGLVFDSAGRLLIAEAATNRVRRVEIDGTIGTVAGPEAGLNGPSGVAVGLGGVIYVADQGNHRIRRIRTDAIINNAAGTGAAGFTGDNAPATLAALSSPNSVALFPGKKNLYVADGNNRRVRLVTLPDQTPPPVTITSVAQSINSSNLTAVPLSGKTDKGSAVTLVATDGTLNVDGTPKRVTGFPATANSVGDWTATFDATNLADGPISVTVNVVDPDGNANSAPSPTSPVKDTVNSSEQISNLKATPGNGQVGLSWTNPTTDFAGVEVRMAPGATPPPNPSAGTPVAVSSTGTSATASGLENCENYSFSVFARDAAGNYKIPGAATIVQPVPSTPPASTLKLTLYPGVVVYPETVTIAGSLTWAGTAAPIPGETVFPQVRRKGDKYFSNIVAGGLTTDSNGTILLANYKPEWSADYRLRHVANRCAGDSTSALGSIAVRPTITAALNASSVVVGGTVNISGSISPAQYGQTIYLQQLVSGGSWRNVASAGLWGTGKTFNFAIRPKAPGRSWYRVFKPADVDHAGNASRGVLQVSAVRVVIAGILADPPGSNDDLRLNEEYITLKNTGTVPVDLYKWRLYGAAKNKYETLPHYTLNPGASVRCHTGSGTISPGHLYLGRTGGYWRNKGDTAHLFDPRGNLASSFRY